jgi:hypothetical membrane protein
MIIEKYILVDLHMDEELDDHRGYGVVRWWAVVSSSAAPVLLIGGWTVAAALRPGFDPVVATISDLARLGTPHRWLMTVALLGLGVCHVVTALGLRAAAPAGRVLLAVGGVATLLVAANPLPAGDGSSRTHTLAAAVAFTALSVWPLARRARAYLVAAAVLCALLGWFAAELFAAGPHIGLSERAAAGAQALWPLLAVTTARARRPRRDRPGRVIRR